MASFKYPRSVVEALKAKGFVCRPFKTYGNAQRMSTPGAAVVSVEKRRGGFTYYACVSPSLRRKVK